YDNPNIRNSGQEGQGSNVALPADNARENTNNGLAQQSLHNVLSAPDGSGNQIQIQHDAANAQILINKVSSSGAPVAAFGSVTAKISDLGGANKDAKFRKVFLCKTNDSGELETDSEGNPIIQKMWVLGTAPEDV